MQEDEEFYSYLNDMQGSVMRLSDHSGESAASYVYDEFGADLFGNQGQFQPFGYTGYQKDDIAGTYYAQAREYDARAGRFISKDWDDFINLYVNQSANLYTFCYDNSLKYVDSKGHEVIVVTGGNDDESAFDYQFVEPAIKNIRDSIANGTLAEDITWMIVDAGYQKEDIDNFIDTAQGLEVSVEIVSNKNEIINYFNKKSITGNSNTRWQDKVTAVTFYCHGLNKTISAHGGENQLSFAYNIKNVNSDNVNFLQSDIEKLDADAFSDTRTVFYSCNAGTKEYIVRGKSFAQEWVNKTGGNARGIVNGRTSYANINSYEGKYGGTIGVDLDILSKLSSILGYDTAKQVRKDDRANNGKGYSEYGSLYNPVMASVASKNYLWEVLRPVGSMIETIRKFDYSWISGHWKTFYPESCE